MMKHLIRAAAAAALGAALCGPAAAAVGPGDEHHAENENAPASGMMSEGGIVGILNEANQAEVAASQMAVERSKNDEVLAFARQMIVDHGDNRRKTDEIGIEPVKGEDARKLMDKNKMLTARLGKLEGGAFDRAYMSAMIEDHKMLLDKLDKKMIPAARTEALVAHMRETRPVVESHLEHARRIKATLGR